jgi:hypothetical protein
MFPGQRLDACGGSGRLGESIGSGRFRCSVSKGPPSLSPTRNRQAARPMPTNGYAACRTRTSRTSCATIRSRRPEAPLDCRRPLILNFFSSLSAVAAASFNPASMRSHSRPYSGPVLPRDLTEPARFKNSFAPIRLLRIFILQLLRGDLCNTISYQTDATCLYQKLGVKPPRPYAPRW